MQSLALKPRKILCLGAHADDIEIGCGGTLLSLIAAARVECRWVVFSGGGGPRQTEAEKSARLFLAKARTYDLTVHRFRDGFFPWLGAEIKDTFETLAKDFAPDVIFTHTREDRHQDHRVLSDLTWNTFRDHLILEYEVPKYDGDLGQPNMFAPLTRQIARKKVSHLLSAFSSQRSKRWFTADTFQGLMRLRGIEAAAPEGFAEAFYANKMVISL